MLLLVSTMFKFTSLMESSFIVRASQPEALVSVTGHHYRLRGHLFEQPEACAALARALKERGYGVWSFTGYLYEDLAKVFRNTKTARNRRLRLVYLAARRRPAAEAACIGCPPRSL